MRTLGWPVLILSFTIGVASAATKTPENQPVEITSTGETNYENGVATARDNVAIHIGDTDIYADYAQYNSRTHEISVEGHVRIYRDVNLYVAERGTYNIDTKQIRTSDVRTEHEPYFLRGEKVTEVSENVYRVENASFTTHDSPKPDFHLRARTVRVYENDHVVFQNVTFYVGNVPVFWWPYMYQSLDDAFSFTVAPADLSSWGPSLLTQVTFPITDDIKGRVRLDYRGRRGVAVGFESDIDYGKDNSSNAKLKTYFIQDQNPSINPTALQRKEPSTDRYRLSLQDRTNFTSDIYGIVDVTKLSDAFVMQDFYQSEFRINPVPDNVVALTKTNPFFTLTGIARFQANDFFQQTERLPEVVLDIKRHALFGGPIFYEGEAGIADLHRSFAEGSGFEDYGTTRVDTFHQLLYPNTYFGWLSVVPRAGFRATYYDQTRDLGKTAFETSDNPLVPNFLLPDPTPTNPIGHGEGGFRTVFDTGLEASFKLSRSWEDVQTRALGLDGLLHVVQPFTDFSYVHENGINPAAVLQFDRFEPSTQLRPIDFPQFTSIDSIASWTVWRLGVRNRLETRRDDLTVTWLELDAFFDVNFDNPYDRSQYSNFFNKLRFTPLPWASLSIDSQIPAFDKGFTEVDTSIAVQPIADLQVSVGHRYLNGNPFFQNSSLFVVGGFYRLNDNWGVGFQEQYEGTTGVFEQQRYSIYRDLTNWIASFGAVVRDNTGNKKEYGIVLTFTLKAFPKFGFDLNFDPASEGQ
ncbi:MAG TPA: LPS assembly protein LptD [Chthoniobacterales bacterium]|nr:LPS assembly protein LptD [Chthoniobacterales bacterium]